MLTFGNRGQKLVETNYWTSEYAKNGLVYVSVNAGAARLLLPRAMEANLPDILCAKEVVISFAGQFDPLRESSIEIMFDDGTESPFCLFISRGQCDRWESVSAAESIDFSVWTEKGGEVFACEAKVRKVLRIPCLLPWHSNSTWR